MAALSFVCGKPGGPTAGLTTFQHDSLRRIFIDFIIVDNVNENCVKPSRDFSHDYVEGEIERTNPWGLGNKLTVIYTPCKC